MNKPDIVPELDRGMLFTRLTVEQRERVAAHAERIRLDDGESLFKQQDQAERFYLLLSGQIKLYRLSAEGDEKVIEVVTPGATFAEALMFLEKPTYPVGALALKPSELIGFDARDFVAMLRESVDTCLLLAADLSQRLHGLIREINDLSLNTGTCRVAAYLLQSAPKGEIEFDLDLPKHVLASRLSLKPETLSRIFRGLTNAGLVRLKGSRILILDRVHLEELASICTSNELSLQSTFHQTPSIPP